MSGSLATDQTDHMTLPNYKEAQKCSLAWVQESEKQTLVNTNGLP